MLEVHERFSHSPSVYPISELVPNAQNLLSVVEGCLGKVTKSEKVSGGLVHQVYKITGENQVGYAKVRLDHYALIPSIPTQPDIVRHEKVAMEILSLVDPAVFPHLLAYAPENSLILMTDVMPGQKTLETNLDEGIATPYQMNILGSKLADIHAKLAKTDRAIREDGDEAYYAQNLHYRLGFSDNQVLNSTIAKLKTMPRQLILGDLSPKNIGISAKGDVGICDLESVHKGNAIFDLGFITGGVLLHSMEKKHGAHALIQGLHEGYLSTTGEKIDSGLLKEITLGTAIYRLVNPVIPYNLPFSSELRQKKALTAKELLLHENLSWAEIVNNMTYEQ